MSDYIEVDRRLSRLENSNDDIKDHVNSIKLSLHEIIANSVPLRGINDKVNTIEKEIILLNSHCKEISSIEFRLVELESRILEFNGTVRLLKWTASAIGASLFAVLSTVISGNINP